MNGYPDIAWSRQLSRTSTGQVALWTVASLAMLTVHAGAAWWALQERPVAMADDAAPAIMVELASVPMAPAAVEEQIAADEADAVESTPAEAVDTTEPVEEVEAAEPVEPVETAQAEPVETAVPMAVDPSMPVEPLEAAEVAALSAEIIEPDDVVEPAPDAVIPLPQPRPEPPKRQVAREQPRTERPRRQEQPKPQQASRQQTRAQIQAQNAPRAAAPRASAGSGSSVSPARWQSRLMAHLERRKRYPSAARRQRQQGVARVRFTIDANGNVGSVSLTRSSGVPALDEEVVALVRRASPVPAPPPGVNRTIVVPIQFSLR